ncbi:hypothetical protein M885DRAFT_512282 [Pelagophyceae sp. CCMP2097]|nr:hypothetical protein M885DRAFT_512282 [Pelagophyceae sp. CCMP2097]
MDKGARLSFDGAGVVTAWSFSLQQLTGVQAEDAIGKTYSDLIAPLSLTDEYRAAALACVANVWEHGAVYSPEDALVADEDICHVSYVTKFALPLPTRSPEFGAKFFVELIVEPYDYAARGEVADPAARGEVKGHEFTLRYQKDAAAPKLAYLCEKAAGGAPTLADGSLDMRGSAEPDAAVDAADWTVDTADGVPAPQAEVARRPFAPLSSAPSLLGRALLREVVDTLWRTTAAGRTRRFTFSKRYDEVAPEAYAECVAALGGQAVVGAKVIARQLSWCLWLPKLPPRGLRSVVDSEMLRQRGAFDSDAKFLLAGMAELDGDGHAAVVPFCALEDRDKLMLTIRIDVDEVGSQCCLRGESPMGPRSATIEVAGCLSMHQLHRAVVVTFGLKNGGNGACHAWDYATHGGYSGLAGVSPTVCDDNYCMTSFRQRVQRNNASYIDFDAPNAQRVTSLQTGRLIVCEHRIAAAAVFCRPGATAGLTDGFTRYGTDYKLALERCNYRETPGPPKCLRSVRRIDEDDWTVAKATDALQKDSYLRRRRLDVSDDAAFRPRLMRNIDFYNSGGGEPLAVRCRGVDGAPLACLGEAPNRDVDGDFETADYFEDDPERRAQLPKRFLKGTWGNEDYLMPNHDDDDDDDDCLYPRPPTKRKRNGEP